MRRKSRTSCSITPSSPACTSPARPRVFNSIWQRIGQNLGKYRSYPRIVGETGGKDFVVVHPSADPQEVAVGLVRGAFEYQGQKCSAASRAYVPKSLWPAVKRSHGRDDGRDQAWATCATSATSWAR